MKVRVACDIFTFLIIFLITDYIVESVILDYRFSEKNVKTVSLRKVAKYKYRRLYEREKRFLDTTLDDRRNLCIAAREYISIPRQNSQSGDDFFVAEAHLYKMDGENFVAIRCPTIPPIYISPRLHSALSSDYLLLIIKSPFCRRCTFNLEAASYISPVRPENYSIEQLYVHQLATVDAEDRWSLCARAQKFMRRVLVFHSHEVQKPRLYEFDYRIRKEKHLAIKCPTTPAFYLRFRETLRTYKEMRIILVELA